MDKRGRGYKIQYCGYIICKYLPYKGGHIGILIDAKVYPGVITPGITLIDAAKDEGDTPKEQLHGRNYLASRM